MKKINARLEYYNSLGPLVNFDPPCQQKQQIVRFLDSNLSSNGLNLAWALANPNYSRCRRNV
jgi:hypothetical protein